MTKRNRYATFVGLIHGPISLITGIYKVAKILADKLQEVVDSLVNLHQTTFIRREGREIMDAGLITCEPVDSTFKGDKVGSCAN